MCTLLIFFHGLNRNVRCFFTWKVKFTSSDTAESYMAEAVSLGQLQAGTVAGGQQSFVLLCGAARDDGADSMQDIAAWEGKCRCDFCPAGFFFMPLLSHQFCAGQPELYSGEGVNGVPYTYHNHTLRQAVKILRIYLCNRLGRGAPNTPRQHNL